MTYPRPGLATLAALSLTVSTLTPALAQEGTGIRGTLSFSQGLEISDNPDLLSDPEGTAIQSRTRLGFGILSETRVEQFRADVSTELAGDLSGDETGGLEQTNNRASLAYTREGAASRLSFDASYEEIPLDDIEIGTELDPDLFVVEGGTRERTRLGIGFATGLGGPFTLEVTGRYVDTRYIDSLDPDLDDETSTSLDAVAGFRINPALTARALAGVSRTEEDEGSGIVRETRYVGAGLAGETAGGLSFQGDLTYDEATTEAGSTTEESGIGTSVTLQQEMPRGNIGLSLSSRIDDAGRRTQAVVSRRYDLPDGGLNLSLGLVDQEDVDGVQVTGGLAYSRETPRGGLSASLTQTPSTDDGTVYINTRLAVSYTEALSETSTLGAGVAYATVDELGGSDDDSRASATITYDRALTEEWRFRTGFEHLRVEDSGGDTRTSNTVFFNVGRDFTFGF